MSANDPKQSFITLLKFSLLQLKADIRDNNVSRLHSSTRGPDLILLITGPLYVKLLI